MAKKKYLKPEYSLLLFVILGLFLLFVPVSFENSRQAGFISKWNEKFNRVEYMFSVINAHITDDMLVSMKKAKDSTERETLLLALVKPYLRINTESRPPKRYNPRYINGSKVYKGQTYFFDDFYFAENNTVIGIKDIKTETPDDTLFIMMFDINGILPPNRWGRDVFGVSIFDGGKIEPFGYELDLKDMKQDCLKTGISCSNYYKIGGEFVE